MLLFCCSEKNCTSRSNYKKFGEENKIKEELSICTNESVLDIKFLSFKFDKFKEHFCFDF